MEGCYIVDHAAESVSRHNYDVVQLPEQRKLSDNLLARFNALDIFLCTTRIIGFLEFLAIFRQNLASFLPFCNILISCLVCCLQLVEQKNSVFAFAIADHIFASAQLQSDGPEITFIRKNLMLNSKSVMKLKSLLTVVKRGKFLLLSGSCTQGWEVSHSWPEHSN